jgi:energy-coupling factor transporter transmembrane protein EcfT
MGIIGVMVLMVKWITTWEEKQMKYALWALASMTLMLLAVSLIALYILPDIAEKWDQVLIGGGLVLGIIGIMSLMVYLMGKMEAEEVRNAAISMVIIAAMLAVTSWIVNELIIPIGEQAEEALYGSGIIVGLIGVMGIMIYLLGQMSLETIAKGAAVVAAIGALLWALGELLPNYVELTKLVWNNAKAVALGGLEIVATLGVWGLIFFALGSFVSGPQAAYLAIGAAVVAGIAAVLWALGELLPVYMDTAMMMEANAKEIAIGGAEIVATLGVWGLIFFALGSFIGGP